MSRTLNPKKFYFRDGKCIQLVFGVTLTPKFNTFEVLNYKLREVKGKIEEAQIFSLYLDDKYIASALNIAQIKKIFVDRNIKVGDDFGEVTTPLFGGLKEVGNTFVSSQGRDIRFSMPWASNPNSYNRVKQSMIKMHMFLRQIDIDIKEQAYHDFKAGYEGYNIE